MKLCQICGGDNGNYHVNFCGEEAQICYKCIAFAKFHILEICPKCKAMQWISCDYQNQGLAYIIIACPQCRFKGGT